eukprot:symbB.v1.2.038668.t1/scaffold6112.1/size20855/2
MAAFAGTVEEEWKPNPPSGEGRRDTQKSGVHVMGCAVSFVKKHAASEAAKELQEEADAAAADKLGDDIHQAAEDGDDPAMRHFLRVAPASPRCTWWHATALSRLRSCC